MIVILQNIYCVVPVSLFCTSTTGSSSRLVNWYQVLVQVIKCIVDFFANNRVLVPVYLYQYRVLPVLVLQRSTCTALCTCTIHCTSKYLFHVFLRKEIILLQNYPVRELNLCWGLVYDCISFFLFSLSKKESARQRYTRERLLLDTM